MKTNPAAEGSSAEMKTNPAAEGSSAEMKTNPNDKSGKGSNRMSNKLRKSALLFMGITLISALAFGCGEKEETVSEDGVTMGDILAEEISADVVPVEAQIASILYMQIPDKFRANSNNTENSQTYVSENDGDNSYICYLRQDKEEGVDYELLTEEDYRLAAQSSLSTVVTNLSCEQTTSQGYDMTKLTMEFTRGGVTYKVSEYIYYTERYIFSVVFAMDESVDWTEMFEYCADTITLKNTVTSMQEDNGSTQFETVSANAISQNGIVSDNSVSEDVVSDNSVSGDSVSEDTVSDNRAED